MKQTNWWKNAVAYQIYPKSFMDANGDGIGDIPGIISKLDYLASLGIDVIWISPMYKSPMFDNGYDISDYHDIDPMFGTLDDFKKLLAEAHKRGLKIIMDLVVNHSSHEHPWFLESKSSKDNPKADWYIWRDEPNDWKDFFSGGGSAWEYCPERGQYYLHMFCVEQPDLNWENEDVRRAVYDMMRYWLEMGVDGFRMDVISFISKTYGENGELHDGNMVLMCANGPRVHEFLKEMRREVLADFDTMTVGETAGVTVDEALKYASLDGSELNMVFHFDVTTLDCKDGDKFVNLKTNIREMQAVNTVWQKKLHGKAWNSIYLSNHDQPRPVTRYGDVGELRERSAKALGMCNYFMEGTPFIYQGEELGMTSNEFHSVEELNDVESISAYRNLTKTLSNEEAMKIISIKGRDGARTPVQWDDTLNAGFSKGKPWLGVNPNYVMVNAAEQEKREDSVLNFYRKMIKLRKALELGAYEPVETRFDSLFIYKRGNVLVAANLSNETIDYTVSPKKVLLHNMDDALGDKLRPFEAVIAEV